MRFFLSNVNHFVRGLKTLNKLNATEAEEILYVAQQISEDGKRPILEKVLTDIFKSHPDLVKTFMGELKWNSGQQRILRERQQALVGPR